MKCKRIQDMMGPYLYGDLAPDEMREVRLHTQACAVCRADVESRGRVVSSLPDKAPELSDQDRLEIAWAVKGAVRNGAHAREAFSFRWGYVAAVASVVLAGLAVAAIVVHNSAKPPPLTQAKQRAAPAVVEIREERVAAASKHTREHARRPSPEETTGQETPSLRDETVPNVARQFTTLGVISRHHPPKKNVAEDKPAPVVTAPEEPKPAPPEEGAKLPKPTDPNDAQTAPR